MLTVEHCAAPHCSVARVLNATQMHSKISRLSLQLQFDANIYNSVNGVTCLIFRRSLLFGGSAAHLHHFLLAERVPLNVVHVVDCFPLLLDHFGHFLIWSLVAVYLNWSCTYLCGAELGPVDANDGNDARNVLPHISPSHARNCRRNYLQELFVRRVQVGQVLQVNAGFALAISVR